MWVEWDFCVVLCNARSKCSLLGNLKLSFIQLESSLTGFYDGFARKFGGGDGFRPS